MNRNQFQVGVWVLLLGFTSVLQAELKPSSEYLFLINGYEEKEVPKAATVVKTSYEKLLRMSFPRTKKSEELFQAALDSIAEDDLEDKPFALRVTTDGSGDVTNVALLLSKKAETKSPSTTKAPVTAPPSRNGYTEPRPYRYDYGTYSYFRPLQYLVAVNREYTDEDRKSGKTLSKIDMKGLESKTYVETSRKAAHTLVLEKVKELGLEEKPFTIEWTEQGTEVSDLFIDDGETKHQLIAKSKSESSKETAPPAPMERPAVTVNPAVPRTAPAAPQADEPAKGRKYLVAVNRSATGEERLNFQEVLSAPTFRYFEDARMDTEEKRALHTRALKLVHQLQLEFRPFSLEWTENAEGKVVGSPVLRTREKTYSLAEEKAEEEVKQAPEPPTVGADTENAEHVLLVINRKATEAEMKRARLIIVMDYSHLERLRLVQFEERWFKDVLLKTIQEAGLRDKAFDIDWYQDKNDQVLGPIRVFTPKMVIEVDNPAETSK